MTFFFGQINHMICARLSLTLACIFSFINFLLCTIWIQKWLKRKENVLEYYQFSFSNTLFIDKGIIKKIIYITQLLLLINILNNAITILFKELSNVDCTE